MKRRALRVTGTGQRLAAFVAEALPVPLSEAEALVRNGATYVAGRRVIDPEVKLQAGAAVMVVTEEGGRSAAATTDAAPPALEVLFEDEAVIAVNKPAGITAQPTPSRAGDSLLDLVSQRLGRPAGLVHRLDRETSGVTVFGKSPSATSALAAEFREGTARKRYLAAAGTALPDRGEISLPISADPSRPGRYRASATANGLPAQTRFEVVHRGEDHTLVALFPQTGRTHQLRAHLTALGAPIAGDARYGGAPRVGGAAAGRCLLHAQALALRHPVTRLPLLIEAPLPGDLARLFTLAGVAAPTGELASELRRRS